MVRFLAAAAALVALAACDQIQNLMPKSAPPANPPSTQAPQATVPQANITPEQRAQLESLVRSLLDQLQQSNAQGFRPAAGTNDEVTSLQPGRDHRYQVNLMAGQSYRILGSCDAECSNVDIELLGADGGVVASDMLADDIPIVNFTAPSNGRYTVRILMQTCTVAPCFAGARVLMGQPGGGKGQPI